MAKIIWSVQNSTGTVTQESPVVSDAQMTRFTDWVWVAYPQLDAQGNVKTKNNANISQAVKDWMTAQWNGTKSNVLRYEKDVAAKAASDAVQDVA